MAYSKILILIVMGIIIIIFLFAGVYFLISFLKQIFQLHKYEGNSLFFKWLSVFLWTLCVLVIFPFFISFFRWFKTGEFIPLVVLMSLVIFQFIFGISTSILSCRNSGLSNNETELKK